MTIAVKETTEQPQRSLNPSQGEEGHKSPILRFPDNDQRKRNRRQGCNKDRTSVPPEFQHPGFGNWAA